MRRLFALVGTAGVLILGLAAPALAQYGGGETTTTSSSTTTTTTAGGVEEKVGETSPAEANPGDNVTFTSPGVFAPGTTVDIVLVRAQQDADGDTMVDNAPVNTQGEATGSFDVPAVEPGIYIVFATGTNADGDPIRVVSILIVPEIPEPESAGASAAAGADSGSAGSGSGGDAAGSGAEGGTTDESAAPAATAAAATVDIPAEVAALQQPAAVEQALFEEAMDNDANVVIKGDRLVVDRATGAESGDWALPLGTAALAVGLALVGTMSIRRRRQLDSIEGGTL